MFGCESEASDLTPDISFCAAASECITEPKARAKSFFYLSAIAVTPTSHKSASAEFFFVSVHKDPWDCVCVKLCVYEAKGELISTR